MPLTVQDLFCGNTLSIPTAPTIHLMDAHLTKTRLGKKRQYVHERSGRQKPDPPVRAAFPLDGSAEIPAGITELPQRTA